MSASKIPSELAALDEQIGSFIEYWGFKRVHGRIWAHLYLSQKPLGTAELMSRLGISKALMSMSIAELLEYKVIREAHHGAYGTVYYEANPDLLTVVLGVLRERELTLLERIETSFGKFDRLPNRDHKELQVDPARLKDLGAMISNARRLLDGVVNAEKDSPIREMIGMFLGFPEAPEK